MAFEFDSDGFLTDRRADLEAAICAEHGELLARAALINRDCHELLFSADVRNRDVEAMLVATLFMRVLEHYQATLILLGIGLIAPAKVALRALLETVFTERAVSIDPKALRAFITDDLFQRRKLIKKAQSNDYTNLKEAREAVTDDLVRELERQIQGLDAKPLRTEELSKIAGMHDWYLTAYALLSKATHTHVRELEEYLKLGSSGEVRQLAYAPSTDEIPHLILTAAEFTLIAASAFDTTSNWALGRKGTSTVSLSKSALQALDEEEPF